MPVYVLSTANVPGSAQWVESTNLSSDAFGRLRVSNPNTIFDSKQIFDKQPLFWDDVAVSGAGTSTSWSGDTASTIIGVAATTAGVRIRQTYQTFNYQPAKSQLIYMTGIIRKSGGGAGIISDIGIGNDSNGLFWRDNEGTLQLVRRTFVTGAPVDNVVDQADWNLDPLDGTGFSGVTIDPTKAQILVIDFEWLGSGRVRIGFNIAGETIYCHQFLNANVLAAVYMSTPNLPLRYRIENDGTGVASTLEHICSSVVSEGGVNDNGLLRYESNKSTFINANTAGTIYVLCGIRLKSTALGCTVIPQELSIMAVTNDNFEWILIMNPTLAAAVAFADVGSSCCQFGVGNAANPSTTTVTAGTGQRLAGGYIKSSASSGFTFSQIQSARRIGASYSGTRDELYLCVRPLAANLDVFGGITWRELS